MAGIWAPSRDAADAIFVARPLYIRDRNLIAASPDLYEALAVLTYWCELHPPRGMPQSQTANARAALTRAEGDA